MSFPKWIALPLALACASTLAACGETVSTSGFKGESRQVAETVSDFQKNATASDEQKLCANDLARTLTKRLSAVGGCQAAIKQQLGQVDALNLTVESIAVSGATATARVKSTWAGKNRTSTLSLVKEGKRWKISGSSR
ncbi:MAG: nuclear transport factor 2 family protein [Solirubrobacteraceae bacterium]